MTKQEIFQYVMDNSDINPNHFKSMLDALDTSNLSDATATAGDILQGKIAYNNQGQIVGTIPSKAEATITPSTTAQVITANQFLSGAQTILGDENLLAENIKQGVTIFGVVGTYTA